MFRHIWGNLTRRVGRSAALLAGLALATTGFTVLYGSTATARTVATGTVDETAAAPYDLVVRPKGNRTPLEAEQGLVRPNLLSGQYGGISLDQWRRIRRVPGVDVAAPLAMAGYTTAQHTVTVDVTDAIDRGQETQTLRLAPTWATDRGLSTMTGDPSFLYVTRRPLAWPGHPSMYSAKTEPVRYSDGKTRPDKCPDGRVVLAYEIRADGETPICSLLPPDSESAARAPFLLPFMGQSRAVGQDVVARLREDGRFDIFENNAPDQIQSKAVDRLIVDLQWPMTFLLGGIDPDQEAKLTGLDRAVRAGRYLSVGDEQPIGGTPQEINQVSALVSDRTYLDEQLTFTPERVDAASADPTRMSLASLRSVPASPTGVTTRRTADEVHRQELRTGTGEYAVYSAQMSELLRAGPVEYVQRFDGTLVPRTQAGSAADAAEADMPEGIRWLAGSWLTRDTSVRPIDPKSTTIPDENGHWFRSIVGVGVFDPSAVLQMPELAKVPMEAYEPPAATGADQRSADALGGRSLAPNSNPGGYLTAPPLMLTTLSTATNLTGSKYPISAVRVRVAGVDRYDDAALARVHRVADEIEAATGLDVDVTLGSSPTPRRVALAGGAYGRPDLLLREGWFRKGVASRVINAVEHRSGLLIGLILVVCALFLGNAAASAVRTRHRDLAVLACLGWPGRRLYALIFGEVLTVGVLAGLLSAGLTIPAGRLAGLAVPVGYALLAVPTAIGIAAVAGALPAWRAARAHPGGALQVTARARRARRHRRVLGLAAANLCRLPGRTLIGAASLAVGVCALTVLVAVDGVFQQALTGTFTLLGDTVLTRVAAVDRVSVLATVLLGALAVADVLYLNIRDRAAELAALQAVGWSGFAAGRLVVYEGVGIGLLGALFGAGSGLGIAAALTGHVATPVIVAGAVAAMVGVLVAAVAALIPTLALRRLLPTGALLAEE